MITGKEILKRQREDIIFIALEFALEQEVIKINLKAKGYQIK